MTTSIRTVMTGITIHIEEKVLQSATSLLRLLQLSSPTLPVGAYAYSQGIEAAVHAGLIKNVEDAQDWLSTVLRQNLAYNDLALLNHLYQAWQTSDWQTLNFLGEKSVALRETWELKMEDQHLAKALKRLAEPMDVSFPDEVEVAETYPLVFARYAVHWNIPVQDTLHAFCWSWLENQIAALVKLVPLGQTQGQLLMLSMDALILQAVEKAQALEMDEIGNSLPMLAILSAKHETQYTRLFRS